MNARKLILTGIVLGEMVITSKAVEFTINLDYGSYSKYGLYGEFVASGMLSTPEYKYYYDQYADVSTYPDRKGREGFGTFCLERNEYFDLGGSYHVTIEDYAINGGISGGGSDKRDWISVGTAWLYSEFAKGTLTGYFNTQRINHAYDLQYTIWWLEGEYNANPNNYFSNLVLGKFGTYENATKNNVTDEGIRQYSVMVMNLTSGTTLKQSQLVYTGVATSVFDGGLTLDMLGFGLAGLSAVGRRFRKS